jgi:hypothetical protein
VAALNLIALDNWEKQIGRMVKANAAGSHRVSIEHGVACASAAQIPAIKILPNTAGAALKFANAG